MDAKSALGLECAKVFLQYLAAPSSAQKKYAPQGVRKFGYEGLESYCVLKEGITIVFTLGSEALQFERAKFISKSTAQVETDESILFLCSITRFALESGDLMLWIMERDDQETAHYISGYWHTMRYFAKKILEQTGVPLDQNIASYKDVFLSQCFELPE